MGKMVAGKVPEIIRNNRYKRQVAAKKKLLKSLTNNRTKKNRIKFPDRFVLGEGYPWLYGTGKPDNPYYRIGLNKKPTAMNAIELNWDSKLWQTTIPRYRLVLERINDS